MKMLFPTLILAVVALSACDVQESPKEEAKEVVDAVKDGDDIGSIGEEAGEVVDAVGESAKDKTEKAADKTKDAFEEAGDEVEDALDGD